ncbi:MAG: B12-binding domain-containing protein [Acidimicrobiia bacterium]|jgi:excisionase family DNA binding protein|nr:MAG: B12-binding domain-containing protein [Acidimicrobiia bacterium]
MSELSLQDVADRLGVHYMTAYKYVRMGRLHAEKHGASWVVLEEDLERFLTKPEAGEGSLASWSKDFEVLILRGDTAAGWTLIEQALSAGVGPELIILEVMNPALRRIGEKWDQGEIDVYDEHLATATMRRLLGRLGPTLNRRGNKRGRVLVAMAAGEMHDLGAEILSEILRGAHYDVLSLGANTPPQSIARAVAQLNDLDAVFIGATIDVDSLIESIAAVREVDPTVTVLVGGGAFLSGPVDGVEADGVISNFHEAVETLDRALGR